MKNGVNIAGISELAHEVREQPEEGQFRYRARASWQPEGGYEVQVLPVLVGTVKAPRRFRMNLADGSRAAATAAPGDGGRFEPEELAMAGLGACAMLTFLSGCTTRGLAVTTLELDIEGLLRPATDNRPGGGRLTDLRYAVRLDAEGAGEDFGAIAQALSAHSPNHRTLVEPNPVDARLGDATPVVPDDAPIPVADAGTPRKAGIVWDYGFQIRARLPGPEGGPHRWLQIDQPKQIGGIDKGPNPQEYLLAGLAASVLRGFVELAQAQELDPSGCAVVAAGRVDIRGMLGVGGDIPVKVQDLGCRLDTPADFPRGPAEDLLREAFRRSPVRALVADANAVRIAVTGAGAAICDFVSAS